MPLLYGRFWTRGELLSRVGDMSQVASIRPSTLTEGRSRGCRLLDFNVGDGMRFGVMSDRCMDIPYLEYRGVPLVWHSRNGIVAPQYVAYHESEWLRSFAGGLVATCGLTQVGQPCVDGDEHLGLHGRIGGAPAEELSIQQHWVGDDYELSARGTMRETRVFGEDLVLTRTISSHAGSKRIFLHDRVENLGEQTCPFMILYHCNAGYPLLGPEARLIVRDERIEPKDEHSRQGLANHTRFEPPQEGWSEQNYWHSVKPDANGVCSAAIVNDGLRVDGLRGLGFAIRWKRDQLWNLVQWKQMGEGDYVSAIEPANCHTLGRVKERELGTLEHLAPGEVREFDLEFLVLAGEQNIREFEARLPS